MDYSQKVSELESQLKQLEEQLDISNTIIERGRFNSARHCNNLFLCSNRVCMHAKRDARVNRIKYDLDNLQEKRIRAQITGQDNPEVVKLEHELKRLEKEQMNSNKCQHKVASKLLKDLEKTHNDRLTNHKLRRSQLRAKTTTINRTISIYNRIIRETELKDMYLDYATKHSLEYDVTNLFSVCNTHYQNWLLKECNDGLGTLIRLDDKICMTKNQWNYETAEELDINYDYELNKEKYSDDCNCLDLYTNYSRCGNGHLIIPHFGCKLIEQCTLDFNPEDILQFNLTCKKPYGF